MGPVRDESAFADAGPVRRAVRLAVTSRPVARLSARFLPAADRVAARLTRGRVTLSAWVTGLPVVAVRTVGARSGLPRTVRLLGIPDGPGVVVIAANFGQRRNPAWYHNVRAHPEVAILRDGTERPFRAEELVGAERDEWFGRAVRMNPGWTRFRDRAERDIPVLRLAPAALG
jgi:deazaflavin-dependent oxidoreductase (nitroreductase family)